MSFRITALIAGVILLSAAPFAGRAATQGAPQSISLMVDASTAPQKILHARMEIPVKPGPLVLYYPEWIPGEHMPDGPIMNLTGLKFMGNGQRISWRRDLVDMFTFHLDVTPGVATLNVDLDFLLSAPTSGFSAGASATAQLAMINWNQVLLYPAGKPAREIQFVPSLRIPAGWNFGTALPGAKRSGDTIAFDPVPLNMLVDSPVLTGAHFRVIPLTPGQTPPHEMDIAADSDAALAMPVATGAAYKNLVAETGALFGSRHYRDYHFLFTLSDDVAHFGLEHHESSDDRVAERTLIDDNLRLTEADLLPHEFTHSWNGKFRRPADLATTDYQQPMRDDLLWVYEGLTEYLGNVLAARSGLWTPEQFREYLAAVMAGLESTTGRSWRPLQDTADAAQILYNAPEEWSSWRRGVDYYDEGNFLWLEVDTTLRTQSHGKVSLNDFCHSFHGGPGGAPALKTYAFDDVVSALNALVPYDWAALLTKRLNSVDPQPSMAGLHASGWDIAWNETPNALQAAHEATSKTLNLDSSLGMVVDGDGTVKDVVLDHLAFAAGIGPNMRIVAVNGKQFSTDDLRNAVRDSLNSNSPIEAEVANGPFLRTVKLDYHGGLRYPHLVRLQGQPDLLDEIAAPLAKR
jgi:predicted metalloprotease with PDZ domain